MVRPPLAGGGHLPRSPGSPRRRDATPVVGPSDRARHALPARAVLARDPARRTSRPPRPHRRVHGRLVPQIAPNLRRCPRRRPAAVLARAGFASVVAAVRGKETYPRPPPRHHLRALPCSLNGQSRAKKPSTAFSHDAEVGGSRRLA